MNPGIVFVRALHTLRSWFRYMRLRLVCHFGLGRHEVAGSDVAIIAWTFPPAYSGGVFRPVSWTRHFASAGQAAFVLAQTIKSPPTQAALALQEQVPKTVRVIRPDRSPSMNPIQRFMPQLDGDLTACLDLVEAAIRATEGARPAVILASGPPFSAFVAGYLLARYWRRPLVIDYRDEWTECPFPFVSSGPFDKQWEVRVNAFASRIVCVSESQREHHLRTFPFVDSERCVVIPNGWEPDELDGVTSAPRDPARVFRIGFAGTLGDHTLPHRFLDVLEKALKMELVDMPVELHFLGSQSEKAREALTAFPLRGVIHTLGLKSKREAHAFMQSMDALLLINDEAMARYIPGKLYDYLASGQPILAYGQGGETDRILRATGGGIATPEDSPKDLADALRTLAASPRTENMARTDWLARHTRARAADRMLHLVRDVAAGSSHA